jgi:hypothetical protein
MAPGLAFGSAPVYTRLSAVLPPDFLPSALQLALSVHAYYKIGRQRA